jgi:hypothetical protein
MPLLLTAITVALPGQFSNTHYRAGMARSVQVMVAHQILEESLKVLHVKLCHQQPSAGGYLLVDISQKGALSKANYKAPHPRRRYLLTNCTIAVSLGKKSTDLALR